LDRFVERHAIALLHFDGTALDPELLAPLDARLADAEVVFLGELNHFIHEKTDFRLFCARYLLSRGWINFAEELGWSDGFRIDRFLKTGDGREFERLPSFGYEGHLRNDRDDRPGGILKVEMYPSAEFVAEERRFFEGVRAAEPRTRLAGIDVDGLPGGGYEDIAQLLDDAGIAAAAFRAALKRLSG